MFEVIAILFFCQLVTAIPTGGTNQQDYNSQISLNGRSGKLKTPDEFLREIFPSSDLNTVWQAITGESGTPDHSTRRQPDTRIMKLQTKSDRQILTEQALGVMCGTPRSVIIDAYKEIGIVRGMAFRLYPDCLRVDRCRNSGCCADGFVCKSNHTDFIKKQFLVFDADARQPVVHSIYRNVVNHASCSCVSQSTCGKAMSCLSTHVWNETTCKCECATRCPDPYAQDRSTCSCECPSGNNQCLKISKGLTKLPKDQCGSLQGNGMSLPSCDREKTFYIECCRCMKRPCEKATLQKLRNRPSDGTPFTGDIPVNDPFQTSSFSASIVSKIGKASFHSNKNYKYKITRHNTEEPSFSSDNSSED